MTRFLQFAYAVIGIAAVAAFAFVLTVTVEKAYSQQPRPSRRLESFHWNPATGVLTAKVARIEGGRTVATDVYEMDMEQSVMRFNGEARGFDEGEAERVGRAMLAIEKYCRDSVDWWEQGRGEPVKGPVKVE